MRNRKTELLDPPHSWVAEKIGFSVPGVSLLRAGKRKPSMAAMQEIERTLGWPMADQVNCWENYSESLAGVLAEAYTKEQGNKA